MEITLHLDVTPEEFFDLLERNIAKDIEDSTGKDVPASKFHGHRYTKTVRQGRLKAEMKVRIKAYQPPERYEVKFTSAQGVTSISYAVAPGDGGGIDVTYTEEYTPNDPGFGLNRRLGEIRYNFKVKERAKKTLPAMEKFIKQERSRKAQAGDASSTGAGEADDAQK